MEVITKYQLKARVDALRRVIQLLQVLSLFTLILIEQY